MKTKDRQLHKMNTIQELNENNNKLPASIINNNINLNQESQNLNITNHNNNPQKDLKENHLANQTSKKSVGIKDNMFINNLSNFASSNLKNEENKSIYSTSKKGESSVYRKFNNNNKNNEKSAFGDSFDAGKQSLKEIIENVNKEAKIFNLIDETIDFLNGDKVFLSNTKEEKDKYEMIEKNKFQKMKENNLEFKQRKIQLTEEHNKLVKHVNQVTQDIIGLKTTYNDQEKNKEDIKNQIYYQENELKELNIANEKIHEMVLDNRMKKNNIVKALVKVCKKHHDKIPKGKKKMFEAFYNKHLEDFVHLKNVDKMKSLKDKISILEDVVKIKNKECENVKFILEKK